MSLTDEILAELKSAYERSYIPDSSVIPCSAIIRTRDKRFFSGSTFQSAVYNLTSFGLTNAISLMVSRIGYQDVVEAWFMQDIPEGVEYTGQPVPAGNSLEYLSQFAAETLTVHCVSPNGDLVYSRDLRELYPCTLRFKDRVYSPESESSREFSALVPGAAESLSDDDIYNELINARKRVFANCSGFGVTALLVAGDGRCFSSVNTEHPDVNLGICAERNGVFALTSSIGQCILKRVYVMGELLSSTDLSNMVTTPCGACRQVLFEYSTPDTEIVMVSPDKSRFVPMPLGNLLPEEFSFANLGLRPEISSRPDPNPKFMGFRD